MAGQQEFVSFVYVRKGRKDFYFILFMKMLKMLVQEKKKGRENAREKILIVKQE